MFLLLLFVNFVIAALVVTIVLVVFRKTVNSIMQKLISDNIFVAWSRYIFFALYVVGISGGVQIHNLERYIRGDRISTPENGVVDTVPFELTTDAWTLEIYRTVLGTLQSLAWVLFIFFLVSLVGYIILKARKK